MHSQLSKKLAEAYLNNQEADILTQETIYQNPGQLLKLRKSAFYTRSLASLSHCNEVLLINGQQKEFNHYKLKTLRFRISEVSVQLEHFKLMLKSFQPNQGLNKN